MTLLALLRHGPTAWSAVRRLQGRHDTSLSAAGRAAVMRWRLPAQVTDCDWLTSPLRRAIETARLLGLETARCEPRLIERAWGAWEGMTLAERRRLPAEILAERAATGLDFQPPGGESPRQVQTRLKPLLAEIAQRGQPVGAITHKGVIRAVFALASGWDMLDEPPIHLDWQSAHLFRLDDAGHPAVERLNLSLAGKDPLRMDEG
jgi:broad specificity phosphatase PhoE